MNDALISIGTEALQQYSALIVAMAAAAAGTLLIWRKLIRPIMAALEGMSVLIQAQLTPNGGESLVDLAKQIKPNHEAAEKHWKTLEIEQVAIRRETGTRLDAIEGRLKTIEGKP